MFGAQEIWLKNQFKDTALAYSQARNQLRIQNNNQTRTADPEEPERPHSADDVDKLKNMADDLRDYTRTLLTKQHTDDEHNTWLRKIQNIVDMHGTATHQPILPINEQPTVISLADALDRDSNNVRAPRIIYVKHRSGKRGGRKNKRAATITMLYGSITLLTDKALHYLYNNEAHVLAGVETHKEMHELRKQAKFLNTCFDVTYAPAAPSGSSEKGNYGGAFLAVRNHINSTPIHGDAWCERLKSHVTNHNYMVGRNLPLKGSDLMMITNYAKDGDVESMFRRLAEITNNGKCPFMMVGDQNKPPSQLCTHPLLKNLKPTVIYNDNAESTCHQGVGSLIDYMIVSNCVAPYINYQRVDKQVPWGPHYGLIINITKDPSAKKYRQY